MNRYAHFAGALALAPAHRLSVAKRAPDCLLPFGISACRALCLVAIDCSKRRTNFIVVIAEVGETCSIYR